MFTTRVLGACSKGNIPLLEELSREGNLKVCLDKFGASGIHYAVRAGKLECLIWLVGQRGLDPNKAANNGATPMHDAAATGQLECLKWLINTGGCYPNMRDFCEATPLHLAARFGHLSIVSWLVESEFCNPLDKAQNGITSIHLAAAKGSLNCLKWIVERDRTAVDVRSDNGATPAYFAAQEGRLDCLKFLIEKMKGNPRLRTVEGMAPVHAAAQMGHVHCLAWLIGHAGVSVSEGDKDGATPLHFAAARGHVKVMEWLLEHGSGQEMDDFQSTPLHDAAEHGQLQSIKVLLLHGADVSVKDMDGMTPSVLAKECGHFDCSSFLLAEQRPPQPVAMAENPMVSPRLSSSPPPCVVPFERRGSFKLDTIPSFIPSRRRHYSWKSSSSSESGSSSDGSLRYRTLQYGFHDNLPHTEHGKLQSLNKYANSHVRPKSAVPTASVSDRCGASENTLPQWKRELLLQRKLENLDLDHEERTTMQKHHPVVLHRKVPIVKRDVTMGTRDRDELSTKFASLPEWKRQLLRQSLCNTQT